MAKHPGYRTYRWVRKDPIIDAMRTIIKSDEHLKNSQVHALSGVATATLDNWFDGDTRKPQNSTICAVSTALGYVRSDHIRNDGTLAVGFRKDKAFDYGREIEKQADWLLKHAQPKQPRKKKRPNGKVPG